MVIHLVDGTYELFRHFYGRRSGGRRDGQAFGAAAGVLHTVLQMLETGATHVGVATDHVIESFRNDLWPGYKTGAGVDPALRAQFEPLEEALAAMGVVVWPMVELEADDALAAAARIADEDDAVRAGLHLDARQGPRAVRDRRPRRSGGPPEQLGPERRRRAREVRRGARRASPTCSRSSATAADGYPGIPGIGKVTAARLVNRHGSLEDFPREVLGDKRDLALLFKDLATLRSSAAVFGDVDDLCWRGPTPAFAAWTERLDDARLLERSLALAGRLPRA